MTADLRHKTITGIFWRGLETVGTQGVQFVLARFILQLFTIRINE